MAPAHPNAVTVLDRPLRLRVMISAPTQDERGQPVPSLAVQRELDAVADACMALDTPVALTIELEIATAKTMQRFFAATNAPVDILHFSGHGIREQEGVALLLEDAYGVARPLLAEELARWLAPLATAPCSLAVLNACHSQGLATALLQAGVQHVIAINAADEVLDDAARVFAEMFYPAVLAGRTVAEAFAHARNAVLSDDRLRHTRDRQTHQLSSAVEALKFRLLPEDDSRHDQPLALQMPSGEVHAPRWERTNLPEAHPDTFVGRLPERRVLLERLEQQRCVLVHGLGGMGKTALVEVTGRWLHEHRRYRDGVWSIPLRNLMTASQARDQIATFLNLDPKVGGSDAVLAAAMRTWNTLLILDDLDMLLQTDRAGLTTLLRALLGCRQLRLLITSRRELPGMVEHETYELSRLGRDDAYAAFKQYAPPRTAWGGQHGYDPQDLQAVLEFLDGYPFPIRLAATYMKRTRCSLHHLRRALLDNPRRTLHFLGDAEDRDTHLGATLDLSYEGLPDDGKAILPLLALFPAGLTRAAAPGIFGEWSDAALVTLLDHSMAEYRNEDNDERFVLPEPARRYAEEKQPNDVMERNSPAVLAFFYELIQQANRLLVGPEAAQGRLILTLEQPNLRAFLRWGYDHEQRDDHTCYSARITSLLLNYWTVTNAKHEPETWTSLQHALGAAKRNDDRWGEANVLRAIGDVQQFRKEMDAALTSYQTALHLFRAVGDRLGEANVLRAIGDVQQFRDEYDAALTSYQTALHLFRAVGSKLGEANVLQALGDVQQFRKEMDAALMSYQTALHLFRAVGDRLGEANVLQALGDVQEFRKEMDAALTSYQTALHLFRAVGDRLGEANVLRAIGDVQQFRDEYDAALTSYQTALHLFRAVGSKLGEANVLQALGDVQQFRKEMDAALTSYQTALHLFRAVGSKLGEANVLQALGDVQQFRKGMDAALTSYQTALHLFRAVGSKLGEANVLRAIGDVQQFRKEMDAALTSYQTALHLFRAVGDRLGEANVLRAIGDVQQFRKEMDAALTSYQTALHLFRAVGDRLGEANVLRAIGDVQQFRDEYDAALTSYQTALHLFRAVGDRLGEANTLAAQSRLTIDRDEMQSRELLEQALRLREAVGDVYGAGADLGNYGIALWQRVHTSEAIMYLQRARDLFASHNLDEQVQHTDTLLMQIEAETNTPESDEPNP